MATIGAWAREQRLQRGLTIAELAERTGVEGSTISRIENGVTDPTIMTVRRLYSSLGLSLDDLMEGLQGRPMALRAGDHRDWGDVLRVSDVVQLAELYQRDRTALRGLLAGQLDMVTRLQATSRGIRVRSWGDVRPTLPTTPDTVAVFLTVSPVYACEIVYPRRFGREMILDTYGRAGALIHDDVVTYLRDTTVDFRMAAAGGLQRRALMTGIDRLKFRDALEIDQQIGSEGMFVGMCAEVCGLYVAMDAIASSESQPDTGSREPWEDAHANSYRRLASLATRLYRWWQFLQGDHDAWLHALRHP